MKAVEYYNVNLNDGFWKKWQDVDCIDTSNALYDQFMKTGRIPAMNLDWVEGMPNKPHIYWDSDVAKWMEGAAYSIRVRPDEKLRRRLEDIIDKIGKGQSEDGYFNSVYLRFYPEKRFTDRTEHELYTAGHFIEAAVAHYEATGETRFLNMMCRFADLIEKIFKIDCSAPYSTPGHEEIELALVRLYEATGEKRYLELSKFFVEKRGTDPRDKVFSVPNGTPPAFPPLKNQLYYNDTYAQDDTPARNMKKAGGHAVRAMYFYSAIADIAMYYGDSELLSAAQCLFDDEATKKMYVTGGISAERYGEAIGTDYVLSNALAYAETCASVAMANFAYRLFLQTKIGKYCDMVERQMYNGALSGLSMKGDKFFYDNALECRVRVSDFFAGIHAKPLYPPYQRQEVFECSCCPPNIYRFIASLGKFFYSYDEHTIWINQYGPSETDVDGIEILQKTSYPYDGNVEIKFENECTRKVALRIPGWCGENNFRISLSDAVHSSTIKDGYLYLDGPFLKGEAIFIDMKMDVIELAAHPDVLDDWGKIALSRGPLIYAVEAADNPDIDIFRVVVPDNTEYSTDDIEIEGHKIRRIIFTALYESADEFAEGLYRPYSRKYSEVRLKAIPYFAWANREPGDMTVWVKRC